MSVHFVTGKLGGGKTLVSVGRIKDYILAGKKVATNLDLNLEYLLPRTTKKCEVYRIPDKPSISDLESIGYGTRSKRDEDFGLLVLDELGTWLNSRTYQKDKERQDVIDWFLHARHLGWDVLLIVQDPELIDKQVRISLGEHVVICRRTDRIPLPFISTIFKLMTGTQLKLPRVHVGSVFYGIGQGAMKVDTWVYRGNNLFPAYDTSQIFQSSENRISQFIPPFYLNQKKFSKKNVRFYMRLTKIYWKKFKTPAAFVTGVFLNFVILAVFLSWYGQADADVKKNEEKVLSDGQAGPDLRSSLPATSTPSQKKKLVRLSSSQLFVNGKSSIRYFYDGVMYTEHTFPEKIIWINRDPYFYAVVDEKEKEEPLEIIE